MPSIRQIAALLVLAAFILFVAQNLGEATIQFLGWKATTSMALPLVAAYLLGGLSGRPLFRLVRSERKRGREQHDKKAQEKARSQKGPAGAGAGDSK